MRKEFFIFLQFILILVLTCCGYFGLLLLQNKTTLALVTESVQLTGNWALSFTGVSLLWFAAYVIFPSSKNDDLVYANKAPSLVNAGVSQTIKYCVIATISALISFGIFIFQASPNVNIADQWQGFQHIFFAFLLGFFGLSLLRLGIIYIKGKRQIIKNSSDKT